MISLRPHVSKATFSLFAKGQLQLSRIPLRLNLRPKWIKHIEVGSIPPQQRRPLPVFDLVSADTSKTHRLYSLNAVQAKDFCTSFSLTCPQCKHPRASDKIQPVTSAGSWTIITCPVDTCSFRSTSNKWWCNCGMLWRRCSTHSRWPDHANFFRATATVSHEPSAEQSSLDRMPAPCCHKRGILDSRPIAESKRVCTVANIPGSEPSSSDSRVMHHAAHEASTKVASTLLKRPATPRATSRQVRTKCSNGNNNLALSFLSRVPSLAARFPHLLTAQHAPESEPMTPSALEQG